MKKVSLVILMALMGLNVNAQEKKILEFCGIPIKGDVSTFSKQLETKGFKPLPNKETMYQGVFGGVDAYVSLKISESTKEVESVSVYHACCNESNMHDIFRTLKSFLSSEYEQDFQYDSDDYSPYPSFHIGVRIKKDDKDAYKYDPSKIYGMISLAQINNGGKFLIGILYKQINAK